MCTWFSACMTPSVSDEMPTNNNCLLYREFHARVVLVNALEDEMKQKLDSTDDAGNTQWKEICEKIDACVKRIDDEKLKNPELTIVERVISDVSDEFDQGLLGYLQRKQYLSDSLKDCLPSEGETWQSFLDSKPNQMEKCEDNLMVEGLNSLREFQTVAKRCKEEIVEVNTKIDITVADNIESQSMEMQKSEITVFYATDRLKFDGIENEQSLSYGTKKVSIPPGHKIGKLEAPNVLARRNPQKHVMITKFHLLRTEPEFLQAIKKELGAPGHVLLYIHGFKTSGGGAIRRAAQLKYDLKFKGVVLAYCWPSEGTFWGYFNDEEAVEKTAEHLGQVITLLSEKVPEISKVHILAHSMGNRALINALTDAAAEELDQTETKAKETPGEGEGSRPFKNVILAAADAQCCKFEAMLQVMYPKDQRTEGNVPRRLISVYSSACDWALFASKKIHSEERLGNTYTLIKMKGWENEVDVVDASGVRWAGLHHSYHAEVRVVLDDIQHLLTNLQKAKNRREVRGSIIKEVTLVGKRPFHAFKEELWRSGQFTQRPW